MPKTKLLLSLITIAIGSIAFATSDNELVNVKAPSSTQPSIKNYDTHEPILKRKVAIGRFSNEAKYGTSALFGLSTDYNFEKQATDIMTAKLAQTNKFILLERFDADRIKKELDSNNINKVSVAADYLILGSVTEFGRKDTTDTGVFTRSKTQTAYAKVSIRIVDVRTAQVIFGQEGMGEASVETGTAFGVGQSASYDATLNDKAISAAISSVIDGTLMNLTKKPWRSYILSTKNKRVIIAGGERQGVKVGNTFSLYQNGETIPNPQTGIPIELPGSKIATLKVIGQFGTDYTNEGSICDLADGVIPEKLNSKDYYVEK